MLKRLRWLVAGLAVGFGSSVWAQHKVKSVAARYSPTGLAGGAATKAKGLPGDVRAAWREGRTTMRAREAELRSQSERPEAGSRGKRPPARP